MSDRSKQTRLVQYDWLESQEGREFLGVLLRRNKRRIFGLLEQPGFPSGITPTIVPFKLLLLGKSAVGKTSTVAKIAGKELPAIYSETPGIQTTLIYWPAKLVSSSKVVLFKLHFWDVGDSAMKKFDHIKTSAHMKPDAVIFFFSFTDSEITEEELRDFQEQWNIPILKICNNEGRKLADGSLDGRAGIMEIAPILNTIIEVLWRRRENENRKVGQHKSSKKRPTSNQGSNKTLQDDHHITDI
ncbi:REM2- and Rab-like small GTPase 1 isoform X2 [Paramuricea clavata]|uniref:REM2- and Rab-like small GTPase 1 isoform X2 n=1 Tax=Paramuricea clavata TaxID=317549 RepID=A0A6S7HXI6_PARCT|nr:REM2- and Rab-like small GTPase 1 isoform X2 [Paramuricea clavata]